MQRDGCAQGDISLVEPRTAVHPHRPPCLRPDHRTLWLSSQSSPAVDVEVALSLAPQLHATVGRLPHEAVEVAQGQGVGVHCQHVVAQPHSAGGCSGAGRWDEGGREGSGFCCKELAGRVASSVYQLGLRVWDPFLGLSNCPGAVSPAPGSPNPAPV